MSGTGKRPVDRVAMVWRDLYGSGACAEAHARQRGSPFACSDLWRSLVVELCSDEHEG